MTVRLQHIVIDAHDLPTLARFWTQVLGWPILSEREREIVIGAEETAPAGICFMPAPDQKIVKNRGHLDLTSGAEERDAEIERILALGAAVGLLLPPGDVGIVHPFGATRFYRHGWTSWRPTAWWPLTRPPLPGPCG